MFYRITLFGLLVALCAAGCASTAEAHGGRGSVRFRQSFRSRGFVNHGFAAQRFVGVPVRSYHAQRFIAPVQQIYVPQVQQIVVPQTYVVPQTFVQPLVVPQFQTYGGSSLQFQFSTGY